MKTVMAFGVKYKIDINDPIQFENNDIEYLLMILGPIQFDAVFSKNNAVTKTKLDAALKNCLGFFIKKDGSYISTTKFDVLKYWSMSAYELIYNYNISLKDIHECCEKTEVFLNITE